MTEAHQRPGANVAGPGPGAPKDAGAQPRGRARPGGEAEADGAHASGAHAGGAHAGGAHAGGTARPGDRAQADGARRSDDEAQAGIPHAGGAAQEPAGSAAQEPMVLVDPILTPALRERLVDMWARVTNAGGAVGFVPPVSPGDIWPTAERSFARVEAGEDTLVCLAQPEDHDGGSAAPGTEAPLRIIAWLLLAESESHLRRHWRTVYRVQVDPDCQGHGLGRRLMLEAARIARDKLGLEALTLMTRGGTGAEHFYLRCGYREVGRIPGAIRVAPGDDRDEVHFWLDLGPTGWEAAS